MSERLMVYKNDVKSKLIAYEDEKNLVINPVVQLEWSLIGKFEQEKGIKIENLADDNEYFSWKNKELEKRTTPLLKKICAFLTRKKV